MTRFVADLPEPPYMTVIFTSEASQDTDGYAEMAARMLELAAQQDGFLGVESLHNREGHGITISYWRDEASIVAWRSNAEHQIAQDEGRKRFYDCFGLRVARVDRAYGFERNA